MKIRIASVDDLVSINEIYNESIPHKKSTADTRPYTLEERVRWFESHNPDEYPVFVAEIENRVVGYVCYSAYRPRRLALRTSAEISYFVRFSNHGMGIGSTLLEYAVKRAGEFNLKFLIAILISHNHPSIGVLKKFGFEEWGRMPGIVEFDGLTYDHLYYGRRV
jgi:phosphinothricin acetyltransferase